MIPKGKSTWAPNIRVIRELRGHIKKLAQHDLVYRMSISQEHTSPSQ
jgi:hypothetical protein